MIEIETAILIIAGVLLFELIVFVHEFGHFITAKRSGVKVNEFALGMGPKLIKFQKGETLYSLRLFPIGGFCAMEGEDEESSDNRAFGNKPVWKRMIIIVAGAFNNFILGLILILITLIPSEYYASTTIAYFAENASTTQYLQLNDEIKYINGYYISTGMDLSFALATAQSHEMSFTVVRDGEWLTFDKVPFNVITSDDGKEIIQRDFKVAGIKNNFGTLISQTFKTTGSTIRMVWASLIGLVTGRFGLNEVAGPIGMTSAISQAASAGLQTSIWNALGNLIFIMAVITVNLGVVNLLPLPALDGGRFVFLVLELIRRKPLNPETEGKIHAVGLILMLLFMVIVSINDVIRLFS